MRSYLIRRITLGLAVLLGSTFIVYILLCFAVNPLENLQASNDPQKAFKIAALIKELDLNTPAVARYFKWLFGVLGYFVGKGTLGLSITNYQPVTNTLMSAIPVSVQLVLAATLLAIVFGIVVGITTAIRQYSSYDYAVTFLSFLLYSLPAFWVAVLLKVILAIDFNNFLQNPKISISTTVIIGLVLTVLFFVIFGAKIKIRLIASLSFGCVVILLVSYISFSSWFKSLSFGFIGCSIIFAGIAIGVTGIIAGFKNKKALLSGLTAGLLGIILYFPMQYLLWYVNSLWEIFILGAVCIGVGYLIGFLYGGEDRNVSQRIAAIVSFFCGLVMLVDQVLQYWRDYCNLPDVGGRPIATSDAATPNFSQAGNFWLNTIDTWTHLILPTIALLLISFASYTRYTRASMLDVMSQDYIRTARAKGLNERTVVVRHALRNALLPLATIIPLDIASVIGGAVITESVFSWRGMGNYFIQAVNMGDFNGVMGYFLVIASFAILATIIADVLYAVLDPRIKLG